MYEETKIVDGEEKFIRIYKNKQFIMGARCNQAVIYDNLKTRMVKAWLNGHLILSTGEISKMDNIEYQFDPVALTGRKIHKGDKLKYFYSNHNSRFEGECIGFLPNGNVLIETGSFCYEIKLDRIISINGDVVQPESFKEQQH